MVEGARSRIIDVQHQFACEAASLGVTPHELEDARIFFRNVNEEHKRLDERIQSIVAASEKLYRQASESSHDTVSARSSMAVVLTNDEKSRIRYYLGYPQTAPLAASIQLGIPRPTATGFLLEEAMSLLQEQGALDNVRRILAILGEIECTLVASVTSLVASELGEMKLHPGKDRGHYATDLFEREVSRWTDRLAEIFAVPRYAYSTRTRGSRASIIPIRRGA